MQRLINQLSSIDRKAALIFNREIKLRLKRGELEFDCIKRTKVEVDDLNSLVDSFNWEHTRQGYKFWDVVWDKAYAEDYGDA